MGITLYIIFIAYFSDVFQLFEVGSYGVTFLDFAVLGFFIVFLKRIILDGEALEFPKNSAILFFGFILISAIISGFKPLIKGSTPEMIQFIKTFVHFLFIGFFAFIGGFYKIKLKHWNNVVKIWLVLSIFINLFGIYQIFARAFDLPLAWLQFTNVSLTGRSTNDMSYVRQLSLHYGNFFRATSIFTEPSSLASFNLVIQIFLIIPFVQKVKPFLKSKSLSISVFVISIITLFLCFSMTGFVGMMLILMGIFIFNRPKRILPFVVGLFATILVIIATDSVIEKYSGVSVVKLFSKRITGLVTKKQGTTGESVGVRLHSGKVGVEIWERNPIIGTGLGLTSYNNKEGVEFGDFSFIAALAEMGLLGFISFTGMFVALFIITGRILLRKQIFGQLDEELKRWSGIVFYLMIYLFLINFISGNNLVSYSLWLFIGLIFSIIKRYDKSKIRTIKLMNRPLKTALNKNLGRYIENNKLKL